jgi:hypothetical protein
MAELYTASCISGQDQGMVYMVLLYMNSLLLYSLLPCLYRSDNKTTKQDYDKSKVKYL